MVHSRRRIRAFLVGAALLGSGALISGCGGSSNTSKKSASATTKRVSLVRAADVSAGATGFKLNMTMHIDAAGHSADVSANGSFTPKAHQGSLTMNIGGGALNGQTLQMQMVISGGTIYMKLPAALAAKVPGGKPWISIDTAQMGKALNMPGYGSILNSSSSVFDPGQYLDYLKAASDGSIQTVGQETIDGVQTTHYRAQVDFSKLPDAVPAAERPVMRQLIQALQAHHTKVGSFPVDVWIDGSNLVRKIAMTLDMTVNGQTLTEAITLDISDYGTQPAPTVPSPGQTTNLSSMMQQQGRSGISG
jgi:hypothetical protein